MKRFANLNVLSTLCGIALIVSMIIYMFQPEQQAAMQAAQEEQERIAAQEERFYKAAVNGGSGDIIVDSQTGVCYLWVTGGYKAGLTVLVDAEGNPVIWEEDEP